MSVQFEQLRDRARPFMAPLPGSAGDVAAAKFEPSYQLVTSEVAKADRASGGEVDWKKVAQLCEELLRTRTKDLLLGAYLAHALHRLQGFEGLTTGTTLLAELFDGFWDTLQPDVKRIRARVNALQWFLDRTLLALPEQDLPAAELPRIEALEAAMTRLAQLVRQRFADAAPALSPLLERIQRMRESATPVAPAAAAPAQPASAQPVSAAPQMPVPPAPELAGAADPTDFLRTLGASLLTAAGVIRRADASDPASYRLLRTGLWLHLAAPPPATNGKTQVPPPPAPLRAQLAALAQNQKWAALLEEAESAAPQQRFALELHRLSWQALAGLGAAHDRARAAIVAELRSLLSRMPQLVSLTFADGSPFAPPETRAWISAEIEAAPATPQRHEDDEQPRESPVAEARKLLASNQPQEALALLQRAVAAASPGRRSFLARLELANVAAAGGITSVAKALYDELDREGAAHALDTWEPALAAECLKGLLSTSRALGNDARREADLSAPFRRLCRLDPAAAHEVWP